MIFSTISRSLGLVRFVRPYSSVHTQKPLLSDIMPSRKVISKLLFDFDARYNYNKYMPVIDDIYDKMGTDDPPNTWKMKGGDILLFQKVLKEIRVQTHSANKYLVDLEAELVDQAAEMGNRDALTMVSFKALEDDTGEYNEKEKEEATTFINELSKLNHPLVFKMGGDYNYRLNQIDKALHLYRKFLRLDNNSFLAADVYKTLGFILFQQQKLMQSKVLMEKSINLAPSSKVAQAHFILGLINEIDPLNARYHFEMAASEGYVESFANLGFLELNYFHNLYKAKKWFRMGSELSDYNAMIGLFDCYIQEKQWQSAYKTYQKIQSFIKDAKLNVNLDEVRATSIARMKQEVGEMDLVQPAASETTEETAKESTEPAKEPTTEKSRWDI